MKGPIFALIDCNNFFVSCEKVFRSDLEGKPVVVLSSNDGCVVARSNEAKALGIPMAAPVFKYRHLFERHKVISFSANFDLYGDISRRITSILATITPRIEIYSVDEAFLDLSELAIDDYVAWGRVVRQLVWQWTGIPVSIGIAPTKTLAKLASDRAKKTPELEGVQALNTIQGRSLYEDLEAVPVQDVWGVGWRLAPQLRLDGIRTAYDLARLSPRRAAQLMGVQGRRMIAELNGTSCYGLTPEHHEQQSIARTRTFGRDTSDLASLEAAVATFATRAAFALRCSGQLTRHIAVFAATNKHKPGYRRFSQETKLPMPSADSGVIIQKAVKLLNQLYQSTTEYHRAGVLLWDFVPADQLQTDLLGYINPDKFVASQSRMHAVDSLNGHYGKHTLRSGAELLGSQWEPRQGSRSPRYTTRIDELPTVQVLSAKQGEQS